MRPDTPLEIQWLAYALAVNNAMDVNAVQKLHEKLGFTSDLTEFAEAVLTKLCEKLDPSEEPGMIDQVQQLVDYAFAQASDGYMPDWSSVPAPAAPAGSSEEAPREKKSESSDSEDTGIRSETPLTFDIPEFDLSGINGYEDLPSLSDTPYLTEDQAAERMIFLLACLRHLGCSDLHISAGSPPFVRRQRQVERLDSYVLTADDAK